MHRHQQSYQRQDCGNDLPRGDVRQRILEARQNFAQAGSIRYRCPIVARLGHGLRVHSRRRDAPQKVQTSLIGVPIHTNVGFQVATVALAGRLGSNGQEVVGQPRTGWCMGRYLPQPKESEAKKSADRECLL